jgi:hypothetical protein
LTILIGRSSTPIASKDRGIYLRPMIERKIRFPQDVWNAIELTAQREGMSAAAVVRIGALSYSAFSLARAGDEASDAMAGLFEAAQRTVKTWPL